MTLSSIARTAALLPLCIGSIAVAALALAGCEDDVAREKPPVVGGNDAGGLDSGTGPQADAAPGADGGSLDCFPDPKTHEELLNRCSSSEKIDKKPVLPLLTADGGLPPLPQ